MNFTDSPYEWMMKQRPYVPHRERNRPERLAPRKAGESKPAPANGKGALGQVDSKMQGGRGNG